MLFFIMYFLTSFLWFSKPSEKYLFYTLIIVGLANFFYELSIIFYNSILKKISSSKNLGKSSGFGFALGYIGGILILIVCIKIFIDNDTLPFGLTKENSENIRATSIVVALWYLIFSIPFLFSLKKEIKNKIDRSSNSIKKIKNLIWNKGLNNLGKFLVARMLYADGLNAIIIMGGIFAVGVFNLEIKDLLILSVLMNITAFIGAIVGGYANDKFTSKSVIILSLVGLIVSSAIILFIKAKIFFLIGTDNLAKFHKWNNWKKIPKLAKIAIFPRQNYSIKSLNSIIFDFISFCIRIRFSKVLCIKIYQTYITLLISLIQII